MYLFGTMLIVSGIIAAFFASGSYALVVHGRVAALPYARGGVYAALGAVLSVSALLILLFVAGRYDIKYVNDYSSRDLGLFFKVASIWAGQPGSFVVWTLWGVIIGALLVRRSRHFEPYVLSLFMFLQGALLLFMLVRNPFIPNFNAETGLLITPLDGKGLNPLLHNFWMIIHPPILFWGYALAAVPFVFALGALWRRDYDTWVVRAMPWTLAAWALLGLALLLGGYWAYETLGWGGYWGWDPVENSSLVPWLMLTALVHSQLMQRTHGGLRRTNFTLAIVTYISVFYATFLTRSGVLSNFSVHSFVEEGIKNLLIGFLAFLSLGSLALLVARWRDIPTRPLSEKLLSRDSFFVLAILALVVIAVVVSIGTSMPVISALPGIGHQLQGFFGAAFELDDGTLMNPNATPFTDGRFSLAPSFYQRTTPPLGIVIVALLIIGPLLGWRDTNLRHLFKALRWPALAAVVVTCASLVWGVREPLALAYLGLGAFAAGTNAVMIARTLRSGALRIGGYLAHLGLMVLIAGVVGSSAYASPEERLVIAEGDTVSMYGFDFTFNRWEQTPDGKGMLDLSVAGEGRSFSARPQLYFNQRMGATMQTPSIHSFLWRDLYISPAEYIGENDPAQPTIGINDPTPWTAGPYELTFLGFDVDREQMLAGGAAEVGAKLKVLYEGKESEVVPRLKLQANQSFEDLPATLPGGHTI
jgi:cytochrome c-type biogenesis protein CcmF